MAKYYLTFAVDGRLDSEVDANSLHEAIEQGEFAYMDSDLNHMETIDIRLVTVTDENDDIVWEA